MYLFVDYFVVGMPGSCGFALTAFCLLFSFPILGCCLGVLVGVLDCCFREFVFVVHC